MWGGGGVIVLLRHRNTELYVTIMDHNLATQLNTHKIYPLF